VWECQYVLISLDFLSSSKAIHREPSLRLELLRVGTPKFLRAVHVRDWWCDNSSLTNQETRDFFTCSRCNWGAEWDDVIFCSLNSSTRWCISVHEEGDKKLDSAPYESFLLLEGAAAKPPERLRRDRAVQWRVGRMTDQSRQIWKFHLAADAVSQACDKAQ